MATSGLRRQAQRRMAIVPEDAVNVAASRNNTRVIHLNAPCNCHPSGHNHNARSRGCLSAWRSCGSGWEEFCQRTSLSGFKYLSSETRSSARKICWGIIMTTLVCLTVYQNATIISNYVAMPYIIKVEKEFISEVHFPKILICNTMPWKVSAVTPAGEMHQMLGKIFIDSELHVDVAKQYVSALSNISDSREYLTRVAFRKEDMIVWCQWLDQRCGPNNFTVELLPDRVCFSFNGGLTELTTNKSGQNGGLQLILDVGHYEQMNGPYQTFGVQQAFLHREDVPSLAHAVSVPAGYYTFVSLYKKQIHYLEGENCGKRSLSLFDRYSRDACIREHQYLSVRNNCSCWPFSVKLTPVQDASLRHQFLASDSARSEQEKMATLKHMQGWRGIKRIHGGETNDSSFILFTAFLRNFRAPYYNDITHHWYSVLDDFRCSLADHLTCALPMIYAPNQDSMIDCPIECQITRYVPAMSFAAVAWEQIQKKFQPKLESFRQRTEIAMEAAKRHREIHSKPTNRIFSEIGLATAAIRNVTDRLLNLSLHELPNLGPAKSLHTFDTLAVRFSTDVLDWSIDVMQTALENINDTIQRALSIFANETFVQWLIDERANVSRLEARRLPTHWFSISKVRDYSKDETFMRIKLALLQSLSMSLSDIRTVHARISKGINEFIYSSNNETVLRKTEASIFSDLVKQFLTSLYDFNHQDGCLDSDAYSIYNYSLVPPKLTFNKADLFGCLILYFSSESIRTQTADNFRFVVQLIPDDMPDAEQQYSVCEEVLCKAVYDDSSGLCQFDAKRLSVVSLKIAKAMNANVEDCAPKFVNASQALKHFVNDIYRQTAIRQFTATRQTAENFRVSLSRVQHMLSASPWVDMNVISSVEQNISAYKAGDCSFRDLAEKTVNVFRLWLETQFEHQFSQVSGTLRELLAMLDTVTRNANNLLNFSEPLDEEELRQNYSITAVINNNLLWGLQTRSKLEQVVGISTQFADTIRPLLLQIPSATASYYRALSLLIADAKDFLRQLVIDPEFFKRNFLIMNVHFAELSVEYISQNRHLEFWKLLADLGGSNGLWLSFSMVVVAEVLDIVVRYCFVAAKKGAQRITYRLARRNEPDPNSLAFRNGASTVRRNAICNGMSGPPQELRVLDRM